jgi:hypothetical protein
VNERFEQMVDQILRYKPPKKKAATQTAAKKRKRRDAKQAKGNPKAHD